MSGIGAHDNRYIFSRLERQSHGIPTDEKARRINRSFVRKIVDDDERIGRSPPVAVDDFVLSGLFIRFMAHIDTANEVFLGWNDHIGRTGMIKGGPVGLAYFETIGAGEDIFAEAGSQVGGGNGGGLFREQNPVIKARGRIVLEYFIGRGFCRDKKFWGLNPRKVMISPLVEDVGDSAGSKRTECGRWGDFMVDFVCETAYSVSCCGAVVEKAECHDCRKGKEEQTSDGWNESSGDGTFKPLGE